VDKVQRKGSELQLESFAMVLDKDGVPKKKFKMDMKGGKTEVPITDADLKFIADNMKNK